MRTADDDPRSPERRARDEQIAAEPKRQPIDVHPEAPCAPVEAYLGWSHRRPVAVAGVVENGLVRPLDPAVKLPERTRVIIVSSEQT